MKFIQVVISDEVMSYIGNGAMLMQYLRGNGLNPLGDVFRERIGDKTVYTEYIGEENEQQRQDGKIPEMARSIWNTAGDIGTC